MTLTEMRTILSARGILLTKSLGQNFLHDANQLQRIVNMADIQPGERVLEIGPGLGPLTRKLMDRGANVLAIELDERLVEYLREAFAANPNFEVVHADALVWLREQDRNWSDWKLVSNLPYSVASPILVDLALHPTPPRAMVVTLQLEVAKRIQAQADDEDYGLLSVLLQAVFEPTEMVKVPPGCFFPEPDVDSGCIVLSRRTEPAVESALIPVFKRIAKQAFSQRRKMMFKLLRQQWPDADLEEGFQVAGISRTARAETVSAHQIGVLTRKLNELKTARSTA